MRTMSRAPSLRTTSPATQPLVSVIVGTYNAGAYLRPAVQSVLDQTYRNLEILIVDDGSTDGSMDTIADLTDPRLRVLHQENRGRPATLNRAIDEMQGDFYVIQDADDLSVPHRIERLVHTMLREPDLAAVFSGHELILDGRRTAPRFRPWSRDQCRTKIERFSIPAHDPTGMFRMSLVSDYRYDTDLPYTEAVDYILRIGEQFPILVVGECLYSYRIHSSSVTHRDPATRRRYVMECWRRACERRKIDFRTAFPDQISETRKLRNQDKDNNLAAHFIESTLDLRRMGKRFRALLTALECARMHPLDLHYHKAWVLAVAPLFSHRYLRRHADS